MRESGSIKALAAALTEAQAELKNAPFNSTNPHFKNKYADLAQLRDCTAPILAKHGLAIVQGMTAVMEGPVFALTTRLLHKSGEWIESTYPVQMDAPQKMGAAITYGRRYCLAAMLGIAGEPDDDAETIRGKEQPDLGSIKGDGPTRFASNVPFEHLKNELLRNDNPPDINLWWSQNKPTRERQLNSEHRWFLFNEMVKHGLDKANDVTEQKEFWVSHTTELGELKKRNASEYHGLMDYKDKAKGRFFINAG